VTILERVPIIRLGRNLLVGLQGDLDDEAVLELEAELTRRVTQSRATGVLIEVSGLTVVDSFIARVIARIAAMTRLLGAETVVVGIQPAVAITLVELGIGMDQVRTALNTAEGMAVLYLQSGHRT
jgi:rsbT antagonist protein RsbS